MSCSWALAQDPDTEGQSRRPSTNDRSFEPTGVRDHLPVQIEGLAFPKDDYLHHDVRDEEDDKKRISGLKVGADRYHGGPISGIKGCKKINFILHKTFKSRRSGQLNLTMNCRRRGRLAMANFLPISRR